MDVWGFDESSTGTGDMFSADDTHRLSTSYGNGGSTSSSAGSDSASSPRSTSSLLDFPRVKVGKDVAPSSLKLELANIELGLSATTSRESLLDELLGDIRRSCATSLASTPTVVSGQSDGEGENVFDCKLRRSEVELRTLSELVGMEFIGRTAGLVFWLCLQLPALLGKQIQPGPWGHMLLPLARLRQLGCCALQPKFTAFFADNYLIWPKVLC